MESRPTLYQGHIELARSPGWQATVYNIGEPVLHSERLLVLLLKMQFQNWPFIGLGERNARLTVTRC